MTVIVPSKKIILVTNLQAHIYIFFYFYCISEP